MPWYMITTYLQVSLSETKAPQVHRDLQGSEHTNYDTHLFGPTHFRCAKRELLSTVPMLRRTGQPGEMTGWFQVVAGYELFHGRRRVKSESCLEAADRSRLRFRLVPPGVERILSYRKELEPVRDFWASLIGEEAESWVAKVDAALSRIDLMAARTAIATFVASELSEVGDSTVKEAVGCLVGSQMGRLYGADTLRAVTKSMASAAAISGT